MKKILLLAAIASLFVSCSKTEPKQETPEPTAEVASDTNEAAPTDAALPDAAVPEVKVDECAAAKAIVDSVEYTEEGLRSMLKTEGKMTDLEFEALLIAIGRCDQNKDSKERYGFAQCPAYAVYNDLSWKRLNTDFPDNPNTVMAKVLKNSTNNPVMRGFIYQEYRLYPDGGSKPDTDANKITELLGFAKEEKDERALQNAAFALCTCDGLYKSQDAADFVLDTLSKHPNIIIRRLVSQTITPYRFQGIDKAKQVLMALCNDEDEEIKGNACSSIFDFEIDNAESLALEYLKDPSRAKSHEKLIRHFIDKAFDSESPDASAYEVVLNYLKTTPRTEIIPYKFTLLALSEQLEFTARKDAQFTKWSKTASFFNKKELIDILNNIILDNNSEDDARVFAGYSLFALDKKQLTQNIKSLKKDPEAKDNDYLMDRIEAILHR